MCEFGMRTYVCNTWELLDPVAIIEDLCFLSRSLHFNNNNYRETSIEITVVVVAASFLQFATITCDRQTSKWRSVSVWLNVSPSLTHYEFSPLLIYTIAKQLKRLIKSAHVTRERAKTTQGTQTTTTRSYTTDQPQRERVYEYSLESTVAHNNTYSNEV